MDTHNERRSNSELYARINALPLTPSARAIAIDGLREGAMIADAILWVANGIKRVVAATALKPSVN